MKVKWLGHASMLMTSSDGLRVVTDPYTAGAFGLDYAPRRHRGRGIGASALASVLSDIPVTFVQTCGEQKFKDGRDCILS